MSEENKPIKKETNEKVVSSKDPSIGVVDVSSLSIKPVVSGIDQENISEESVKSFEIESEDDEIYDSPKSRMLNRLKVLDKLGKAKIKRIGNSRNFKTTKPSMHITPPDSIFNGNVGTISYYVYHMAKDGNKGVYVNKDSEGKILSIVPAIEKQVIETFEYGKKISVKEFYGVEK